MVMRALVVTAIVALTIVTVGCGRSTPTLTPLASDAVVLAFGDSLTAGNGANATESYPALLERRIGRKVVNAGRSGETSEAGRARLPGLLDEIRPQLLVLIHGGNDFLRKHADAIPAANVRAMVVDARSRGIPVVLLGVPKPGLVLSTASFYGDIANDAKLPFDGDTLAKVLGDNALKSDLVHPNAAGYARIAEAVENLLKKARAL
jgi:acyl-CoA thioesterase I